MRQCTLIRSEAGEGAAAGCNKTANAAAQTDKALAVVTVARRTHTARSITINATYSAVRSANLPGMNTASSKYCSKCQGVTPGRTTQQ